VRPAARKNARISPQRWKTFSATFTTHISFRQAGSHGSTSGGTSAGRPTLLSISYNHNLTVHHYPAKVCTQTLILMTAGNLIKLLEEMMDIKIQQHAQATVRSTPEMTEILREKRETDRRRLDQIRSELIKLLEG
jgi:hypothetical protein